MCGSKDGVASPAATANSDVSCFLAPLIGPEPNSSAVFFDGSVVLAGYGLVCGEQ